MYQNRYSEPVELTLIGTTEELNDDLTSVYLKNPYLFLKFRPICECGKEFRSSGMEKAEKQIAKHVSFKTYKDCKPTISEMIYKLPEFVTVEQIYGTDANRRRNRNLLNQIESSKLFEKMNTRYGKEIIPTKQPSVSDGYQVKQNFNIIVTITSKSKIRLVRGKSGDDLTVCEVTLKDINGDGIIMTLWNDQCLEYNVGDNLTIHNAYTKDGQYWIGNGIGYGTRTELGTYKNATKIQVQKPESSVV